MFKCIFTLVLSGTPKKDNVKIMESQYVTKQHSDGLSNRTISHYATARLSNWEADNILLHSVGFSTMKIQSDWKFSAEPSKYHTFHTKVDLLQAYHFSCRAALR